MLLPMMVFQIVITFVCLGANLAMVGFFFGVDTHVRLQKASEPESFVANCTSESRLAQGVMVLAMYIEQAKIVEGFRTKFTNQGWFNSSILALSFPL